jgi:uncharacterized membrane protein
VRRAARRLREDPAALVVTIAALAWFAVLALDVWRRHDRFETFDYDLGFHSHYVWLLSRGRAFSTIVGLPAFGHNATVGYLLFVPSAWLGLPIPHVLNLAMTAALALGVVPVLRLARRRIDVPWIAAAVPLAYLLHPLVQGNVAETFHPDAMAITPLLAAYDAADERRWRRFWLFVALAIIWKADVALYLVFFGLVVVRRWDRRLAAWTVGIAAAWFAVAVFVVIPSQAGGTAVWGWQYGDLGDTPGEMLETSVRHPSRLLRHVEDGDPLGYARDLLVPYGFVPALAPAALAAAGPQLVLNTLSDADWTRRPIASPHYQALPTVAMTLGLVEGLAFVRRRRRAWLAPTIAVVTACALATTTSWGALRISARYANHWTEDGDPLRQAKEIATAMPGSDDVVSATWRFVPHLVERASIYAFPNPWQRRAYGVGEAAQPDPARIEWIILDLDALLDVDDHEIVDCIIAAGTFDEELRVGPIVVLHRDTDDEPVDAQCS